MTVLRALGFEPGTSYFLTFRCSANLSYAGRAIGEEV
jgi:hypothetical protein